MFEEIADFIVSKVCDERRKYNTCNCLSGKGKRKYNPCQRAYNIRAACLAMANGQETTVDLETVLKFVSTRRCYKSQASESCGHNSCWKAENLQRQLEAYKQKAA